MYARQPQTIYLTTKSTMNFTEAFDLVDAAIFSKTGKHLSDPEVRVLQGAWEGLTYEKMANASEYTLNYLMRDVGPNLWKTLSMTLGEDVSKTNFRAALERQRRSLLSYRPTSKAMSLAGLEQSAEEISLPRQDWGDAVDVSVFYGRQEELSDLKQWIVEDQCKLVTISGLTEIGKSALATKMAEEIQDEFDYVIWRSMRRFSPEAIAMSGVHSSTSPLTLLIAELIQFLSNGTENRMPETIDQQISLLLHYLRSPKEGASSTETKNRRALIILDGMEKILHSKGLPLQQQDLGRYEQGYEQLGTLLKRIAQEQHSSCLVLTTQKNPYEIASLAGENRPVREFQLKGLHAVAAKELFKEKGIDIEENSDSLEFIINKYEGHYSVLNKISYLIKDIFNHSVGAFIENTKSTSSNFTARLTKDLIQDIYQELGDLEKEVLNYIAEQEESVSLAELQEGLSINTLDLIPALSSLSSYSFINKMNIRERKTDTPYYSLPHVVKRYVISLENDKEVVHA